MIIRAIRDKNYSVINNTVLRDSRLSWRARGLAAYILTQPDDWAINSTHLWKQGTEGRDAVRKCLVELREAGYLKRFKYQKNNGQWSTELHLSEIPTPENQSSENQSSENQSSENQSLILSTNILSTNRRMTNKRNTKAAAALSPPFVNGNRAAFGSARADQEHPNELDPALRLAAHAFGVRTFDAGEFRGLTDYIDALPADRLRLFCAWCHIVDEKTAAGHTDVDDYVRFVRGCTDKATSPGFGDADRRRFEQRLQSTINQLESDIWEDSQQSDTTP